jgi:hypothetical protein
VLYADRLLPKQPAKFYNDVRCPARPFNLIGVFPHNAVVVYPAGVDYEGREFDWKKSGIVLDAWKDQNPALNRMVYKFKDWYGTLSHKAVLLPENE